MIDLTPLDVRKKKGDFRRALRGYEPEAVDQFLDLVADRLEELVRENAMLRDRNAQVGEQLTAYRAREQAMNDALVTAQQLREEVRQQAGREAELTLREARSEAERIVDDARRQSALAAEAARRVHAQRARYLRAFRALVERQLGELEAEEERLQETTRGDAPMAFPAEGHPEEAQPDEPASAADGDAE